VGKAAPSERFKGCAQGKRDFGVVPSTWKKERKGKESKEGRKVTPSGSCKGAEGGEEKRMRSDMGGKRNELL